MGAYQSTSVIDGNKIVRKYFSWGWNGLQPFNEVQASSLAPSLAVCFSQPRWPEQAEELLGLIVDSLRALEGAVGSSPSYHEPSLHRRPHSARKMAVILQHAPPAFQSEIVALVPRLVEPAEHCEAAAFLLQRLGHSTVDPMVQLPVSEQDG